MAMKVKKKIETKNLLDLSKTNQIKISGTRTQMDASDETTIVRQYTPTITAYLMFCSLTAAIGSFFMGWNLSVLNNPLQVLRVIYNESYFSHYGHYMDDGMLTTIETLTSSLYLAGGVIGSLSLGIFGERFGRVVDRSTCGGGEPINAFESMIVGRVFFGIYSGVFMSIAPVYISEMSAIRFRGKLSAIPGIMVTLGALVSSLLGISAIFGNEHRLTLLFVIPIVILAIQFVCLFFCKESPKFLLLETDDEPAVIEALGKLRKCEDQRLMEPEIYALREERAMMRSESVVSLWATLKRPYIKRTAISLACHAGQQLTGINGILFYSNTIFLNAGLSADSAVYGSVGVTAVLFLASCASSLLVERAGRRILLLVGFLVMTASSFGMVPSLHFASSSQASAIFSILLQIAFVAAFSIGIGTIGWMITPELFPFKARRPAILLGVTVNWMCNLLVVSSFLFVQRAIGPYSFILFGTAGLFFTLFTYFAVPETKNRSPQEIAEILNDI